MKIVKTELPGVLQIIPQKHSDLRGHFFESWNQTEWADNGLNLSFVQENEALSKLSGTVRGLHFQAPPNSQDKLVRCLKGLAFDVVVDVRRGSPSYGKWAGFELSCENELQILVPEGFLHGYVTLLPETVISYKCTNHYAPESEGSVHFADPDLGINWPIAHPNIVLSDKDREAQMFADFDSPFTYPATSEAQ